MNKKALYLGIGLAVLILLGFLTFQHWGDKPELITYQEPSLTAEARAIYEQRLADAEKQVVEITAETSADEKFNRYMNLGSAQFSLGYYLKAKESYDKALEISPQDPFAWKIYSATLSAMQDYDGALAAVKKAITLRPIEPEFYKWQIDLEKDHFEASDDRVSELYKQALEQTRNDINIITAYATFLEQKGDLQGALAQWQKAYEVNSAGREAYQVEIDRLKKLLGQ